MVFSGYIKNNQDDYIVRMMYKAGTIFIQDTLQRHRKDYSDATGK
jgi:hypothetical protein